MFFDVRSLVFGFVHFIVGFASTPFFLLLLLKRYSCVLIEVGEERVVTPAPWESEPQRAIELGGYGRPLTSIDFLGLFLLLGRRDPLDLLSEGGVHTAFPRSFFTRTFFSPQGFVSPLCSFAGPLGPELESLTRLFDHAD